MKIEDLKQRIGSRARDIIVNDLCLKLRGTYYTCCTTKHKKGDSFSTTWSSEKLCFFCHDCNEPYDICNHAETKGDKMAYLHQIANVDYKPRSFDNIQPVYKKQSQAGIEYLNSRGISKETLKKYKVTCDESWIYFNYCLPNDGGLVKVKQRVIGDMANGQNKYTAPKGGANILYGMGLYKSHKILAICEGEIDALSLHECAVAVGKENEILCTSIPSGSGSFGWVEDCKNWLDMFKSIIIIPDSDECGNKFLEKSKELLENFDLMNIDLPVNDVNEYLCSPDYHPSEIFKIVKKILPEIKGVKKANEIARVEPAVSISTGYLTQDYNDSGFRMGCVALYTGRRGEGKTTYTRQGLISVAKQKQNIFMFCGESSAEYETDKLARLSADYNDIESFENIGGRVAYRASELAIKAYHRKYGKHIILADLDSMKASFPELIKDNSTLFKRLLQQMKNMAKLGVRVFVLDNLMIFGSGGKRSVFDFQREAISDLSVFAVQYKVHVCLIAHPKAGDGHQKISGAMELENTAHSLFRYVRVNDDNRETLLKKIQIPEHVKNNISAILITEKVRDDGSRLISLLEWDEKRGAVYDVTTLRKAHEYESKGYWTRAMNRMSQNDNPPPLN